MSQNYTLKRSQTVRAPIDEVTLFFEDPRNLGEITPPFLQFQMKSRGNESLKDGAVMKAAALMKEGAIIDYTIRLHGVPLLWRSRIEHYTPGVEFVDVQLKGPYKYWHHLHTFRSVSGGTEIGDLVTYSLPFGLLGSAAHRLFVKRQLEDIFNYRTQVVAERFGSSPVIILR